METGNVVKLKLYINDNLESEEHFKEFNECIGIVEDRMFSDTDEFYNVRWYPSKLRYGYKDSELYFTDIKIVKHNSYLCKITRVWDGGYYDLESIEETYLDSIKLGISTYLSVHRSELLEEGNKNI